VALWKRPYASLSEISCHYACNFPRGRDGGGRESRDIRWLAGHDCLSNVKRSSSFTSARDDDFSWVTQHKFIGGFLRESTGKNWRPRFAQSHYVTNQSRPVPFKWISDRLIDASFLHCFCNVVWRLLNYYNWRIILIDLIIRDIFIIIICVFRRRSNGFQPKRTHPLLECAAYCYGEGN